MSRAGTPEVSVIVPTLNRMDTLPEVLEGLELQETEAAFEIVVVDDGSGPETVAFLAGWVEGAQDAAKVSGPPRRMVRQLNQGPAAARNAGVREARGHLVAFLGDDTVPHPSWLQTHWRTHQEVAADSLGALPENLAAIGVIGYTQWHPRMKRTAFLDYINEYGLQFGYALIEDKDAVPFNFFYTSNLSLPRRFLLEEPFDQGFPYAAWEDIEVSYRLKKRGFRLLYRPEARVDHDHPTDLERFCTRQEKAGFCAVVFHQRHPELGSFLGLSAEGPPALPMRGPYRRKRALARGLQMLERVGLNVTAGTLWEDILRYHYIEGLRRGWADLAAGAEGTGS